ncbi:12139_t:CDS:2 [Funneliformis geosporum]|uniref:13103_t:CDS:1 n=1 Tax=Funneliformis geosporum TaxID=1117311 RepID=A0A9W4WQL5_9GLOM|nr:12139_t:CDS:2 [Funneliformis geosporum]CAI2179030.1 13103_t:CDS:2 [Funneliformis geosporum]
MKELEQNSSYYPSNTPTINTVESSIPTQSTKFPSSMSLPIYTWHINIIPATKYRQILMKARLPPDPKPTTSIVHNNRANIKSA